MSRTVLITGAGGFVGSHLAQGFLARGDAVIALDLTFDPRTRKRLAGAVLVEAPMIGATLADLPHADLVIHGAAITTSPAEMGMSDTDHVGANMDLLTIGLDHAIATSARDFVFVSSSGVFGPDDGVSVHLETTTPHGNIPYALAKLGGEAATAAADRPACRAISVRLGPIYGPDEAARSTRLVVSQVRRWLDVAIAGQPIVVTMPEEQRDWTYAPDLAHALCAVLAVEPKLSGVIHLTSADILANLDLAHAASRVVAGSTVLVQPSGQRPRLPMASSRVDMPALYPWTPLSQGLARTLGALQ